MDKLYLTIMQIFWKQCSNICITKIDGNLNHLIQSLNSKSNQTKHSRFYRQPLVWKYETEYNKSLLLLFHLQQFFLKLYYLIIMNFQFLSILRQLFQSLNFECLNFLIQLLNSSLVLFPLSVIRLKLTHSWCIQLVECIMDFILHSFQLCVKFFISLKYLKIY